MEGLPQITEIDAGGRTVCAIAVDGRLFCWGYNAFGEVGDGSSVNRSRPVAVKLPKPVSPLIDREQLARKLGLLPAIGEHEHQVAAH